MRGGCPMGAAGCLARGGCSVWGRWGRWVGRGGCPVKERSWEYGERKGWESGERNGVGVRLKERGGKGWESGERKGWESGERNGVGRGWSPMKGRGGNPVPQYTRLTATTPYPAWTPSRTPTLPHLHTPTLPHSHTPTLPHSRTPTLPHSHTLTLPHKIGNTSCSHNFIFYFFTNRF